MAASLNFSVVLFAANKRVKTVGTENHSPAEILRHMVFLRSSAGRKTSIKVKHRLVTDQPSIQGGWTASMQPQQHASQ